MMQGAADIQNLTGPAPDRPVRAVDLTRPELAKRQRLLPCGGQSGGQYHDETSFVRLEVR